MTCAEIEAELATLRGGQIVRVRAGEKEIQYANNSAQNGYRIRWLQAELVRKGCNGCGGPGFIRMTPSDC